MKTRRLLLLFLAGLLLWSCKTPQFAKDPDWSAFNGVYTTYTNDEKQALGMPFWVLDKEYKGGLYPPAEFALTLKGDSLYVTYKEPSDTVIREHTIFLKGKKKKNYWQYTYHWSLVPLLPIFLYYDVDKVRIGLDEEGNLLVKPFVYTTTFFLIAQMQSAYEPTFVHPKMDKLRATLPYPYVEGNRYGVKKGDEVLLSPMYHYISVFSDGVALVENNKLWGAVSEVGQEVIPIMYNELFYVGEDGVFLAKKGGYFGLLDKAGDELKPFVYDEVRRQHKGKYVLKRGGEKEHYKIGEE